MSKAIEDSTEFVGLVMLLALFAAFAWVGYKVYQGAQALGLASGTSPKDVAANSPLSPLVNAITHFFDPIDAAIKSLLNFGSSQDAAPDTPIAGREAGQLDKSNITPGDDQSTGDSAYDSYEEAN